MSRWFRVYSDLIDDPKFIKLGPDLRSALLMTWCVASGNDGRLPSLQDIAIKFRLSEPRTLKMLNELRHCGFIDDDETGSAPHNWSGRQYLSDVSTNRVKQFRKRQRNVSPAVSETPPDTEQIQTTEASASVEGARAPRRKATRLETSWVCSRENVEFAEKRGLSFDRVQIECAKFTNYWTAKSGKDATKLDWDATWRNWILNSLERGAAVNGSRYAKPQADKSVVAAADRILERLQSFDEPIGQN